jgi:hypothetical protein
VYMLREQKDNSHLLRKRIDAAIDTW